MTVRVRILLLLTGFVAAFLAGVVTWQVLERRQVTTLSGNAWHDKSDFAQTVLSLRGESLATLATDYTYWDDMVRFVGTADKAWAKQNIDACLTTYKASTAWVYNRQQALVYRAASQDLGSLNHPAHLQKALLAVLPSLHQKRFCHFFARTPDGLMEVRGATIHRTMDPQHKGPFFGYFFVTRLWDGNVLKEIARVTKSTVALRSPGAGVTDKNAADGSIRFARRLEGWDGAAVADLCFENTTPAIKLVRASGRRAAVLSLVFALVLLGLFSLCLVRWVNKPLAAIAACLRHSEPQHIAPLARATTEFGDLARLIQQFFAQKQTLRQANESLEARVEERTQELRSSQQRFEALVRNASDVITILDTRGFFQYVSPAAARAWGTLPPTLLNTGALERVHPEDRAATHVLLSECGARPGATLTTELRLRHSSGAWRSCELLLCNLLAETGVGGIVATFRDVTERKDFEEQLQHQAFHDALTGLPNRALFADRLKRALTRTERRQSRAAVLFVDLDHFKVINDSLGHEAGDHLLVTVAERLQTCVRAGDTVARLGGDEFVVLIEEVEDIPQVTAVAERIIASLGVPVLIGGRNVFTAGSVGVVISQEPQAPGAPTSGETADSLLRDADTAMYQAKSSGKGRFVLFDRSMSEEALERLELEADLRRALADGELVLHYQPIVRLDTGQVREMEALVRWQHPTRGLIPPLKFISIAEETGLIVPLGEWVLSEACRQAVRWQQEQAAGSAPGISVNLSARQLLEDNLVERVERILAETGLNPSCLKLEITESVMMSDTGAIIKRLEELRALGVKLAVDDFGTGYSSLNYLSSLPINTLKIDRAFIQRLTQRGEDHAIVQAILQMAKTLGLEVTSEGIETAEQLEALQAMGCDQGQGYYFGRPTVSADASALLLSDLRVKEPRAVLPAHEAADMPQERRRAA